MAIGKYSETELQKLSMIELANLILAGQKKEMNFIDLFDQVAKAKSFTASQKTDLLARFYTDLNIDGRFMTLGANVWGLKRWYPVDQTTEKSLAESRKRDAEEEELEAELLEEDEENEEEEENGYPDYDDPEYDEMED